MPAHAPVDFTSSITTRTLALVHDSTVGGAKRTQLSSVKDGDFELESCVRGHHVYQCTWIPALGEELQCLRESSNSKDPYAVAVLQGPTIVGHVPRRISATCSVFLRKGGTILCIITAGRRYSADLPQGGLEVPCTLRFRGKVKDVKNLKKLFTPSHHLWSHGRLQTVAEQPTKKRKVDVEVVDVGKTSSECIQRDKMWQTFFHIELSMANKDTIACGGLLSDKHIDFAQAMLEK